MRIARFTPPVDRDGQRSGDPLFGIVGRSPEGEETVLKITGDPLYSGIHPTGEVFLLVDVRLLAPVIPRSKVVCVGRNYADHAAETGSEVPLEPLLFLKPNTSVIGPLDAIVWPRQSQRVDHEGELAVVIGRLCKDVPREKAGEVIFGYTVANDVTARDLQKSDGQWARAKGFDTFCPLGPWIETELDPSDLAISVTVDGELRQSSRTSSMIFKIPEIIEYASAAFTLLPGDVILTGTPAGVGLLPPGCSVNVTIENIGTLENKVISRG
jgi:2-keto-4-pentenoate hydratase/2-oxohepta-3-ene-1,7-dioic acid hydratase in catechol pathway